MRLKPEQQPTRIGIIGDVHAEHRHLEQAIDHLTKIGVDMMICTGDIVDGVGDVDRCIELLQAAAITVVRGNHDRWLMEDRLRGVANAQRKADLTENSLAFLAALPLELRVPTVTGNLLLCHGVGSNDLQKIWPGTARMPAERCEQLDGIVADEDIHLMVNGHVHYRTLIHFERMLLINAGTLRGDHHPGFSLLDLAEHRIEGFEFTTGQVERVRELTLAPQADTRVFNDTQCFDGDWTPITLYA